MTPLVSRFLMLVALSPCVLAQTIHVVDAAGGTGSQFVDLQSAVNAASSGDRIHVRAGTYDGFVADGKALSLVGEFGVLINGANSLGENVTIQNLPDNTDFVVRDLQVAVLLNIEPSFCARNCGGRIVLDYLTLYRGFSIDNCAHVAMNQIWNTTTSTILASQVSITNSDCIGTATSTASFPAIQIADSTVELTETSASGGGTTYSLPGGALSISNSSVSIRGTNQTTIAAAPQPNYTPTPMPAILGDGTLIIDPAVNVRGHKGLSISGNFQITNPRRPATAANGGRVGFAAFTEVRYKPLNNYVLMLGAIGDPVPFPQLGGSLGINLATLQVVSAGTIPGSGIKRVSYLTPTVPLLAGAPIGWAALAGNGSSLRLSNTAVCSFSY